MLRVMLLLTLWAVRLLLGITGASSFALLLTDFGIVGSHLWATSELRRQMGAQYGFAPSWTKLLEGALGFGVLLGVFDLVHALK